VRWYNVKEVREQNKKLWNDDFAKQWPILPQLFS
jgi:hypothetical protein